MAENTRVRDKRMSKRLLPWLFSHLDLICKVSGGAVFF